jgi:2-succinyl-6-hydroxy-2,4-cyclohexadiene-1-carboxylate synthase
MFKILFLHGFLGDAKDWEEVISFLPDFECHALSYPFLIPQDGILVGYSMGGRIAASYPHPKILISSHLGLLSKKEKIERQEWEKKWCDILKSKPFPTFLKLWYEQPLFSSLKRNPQFPAIFARRLSLDPKIALHQLENYPLSNHSFSIPENTHFLCGTEDLKYINLYNQFSLNPSLIERSSHACHLEQPLNCASLIRISVERVWKLSRYQISQSK